MVLDFQGMSVLVTVWAAGVVSHSQGPGPLGVATAPPPKSPLVELSQVGRGGVGSWKRGFLPLPSLKLPAEGVFSGRAGTGPPQSFLQPKSSGECFSWGSPQGLNGPRLIWNKLRH